MTKRGWVIMLGKGKRRFFGRGAGAYRHVPVFSHKIRAVEFASDCYLRRERYRVMRCRIEVDE